VVPVALGRNRQLGEQLADAGNRNRRVGPLVGVDAIVITSERLLVFGVSSVGGSTADITESG
jgi:hypothetical protein